MKKVIATAADVFRVAVDMGILIGHGLTSLSGAQPPASPVKIERKPIATSSDLALAIVTSSRYSEYPEAGQYAESLVDSLRAVRVEILEKALVENKHVTLEILKKAMAAADRQNRVELMNHARSMIEPKFIVKFNAIHKLNFQEREVSLTVLLATLAQLKCEKKIVAGMMLAYALFKEPQTPIE